MITTEYTNRYMYGIESDIVRYTWAGYCLFILLSSLIGDSIILLVSVRYRVFKLHKVIIVFIQHIAVCDLLNATTFVASRAVSLLSDGRILEKTLCLIVPYTSYYLNTVAVLLICGMTCCKLFTIKYPLAFNARCWTLKKAHLTGSAIWAISSIVPLVFLIADRNDISFDFRSYVCDYQMSTKAWKWLSLLLSILFIFLPTGVVVTNTVLLLMEAKQIAQRGREPLKMQGIMATVLTAIVYCISVIPYAVYRIGERYVNPTNDPQHFFQRHYFKIAQSFVLLNTISNFYIYCMTLSSFREFLWSKLKLLTCHNHGKIN